VAGRALAFEAAEASEAYSAALLHVLRQAGKSWPTLGRPAVIH